MGILVDFLVPHGLEKTRTINFRHVAGFGPPATGKTTWFLALAKKVEEKVDELGLRFRCYRCLTLEEALDHFISHSFSEGYLYFFIDDAEVENPSLKWNWQMNINHDLIRHKLKNAGFERGMVAIVYATQRMKNLQKNLRNAQVLMFFGAHFTDPDEKKWVRNIVGRMGVHFLKKKMRVLANSTVDDPKVHKWLRSVYIIFTSGEKGVLELKRKPQVPEAYIDLWSTERIVEPAEFANFRTTASKIKEDMIARAYRFLQKTVEKNELPVVSVRKQKYLVITRDWLDENRLGYLSLAQVAKMFADRGAVYKYVKLEGSVRRGVLIPL